LSQNTEGLSRGKEEKIKGKPCLQGLICRGEMVEKSGDEKRDSEEIRCTSHSVSSLTISDSSIRSSKKYDSSEKKVRIQIQEKKDGDLEKS